MRNLIINGIVVSEPQIKIANSGNTFTEFRMVNHENKQSDKDDFWFTCRSSHGNIINLAKKYIKKGTRLIVTGQYSNEIYINNQQVATISNNLWITDASFLNEGNNSTTNTGDEVKSKQEVKSDMDNMTSETPETPKAQTKKAQAKKVESVNVEDTEDDDLPF